MWLFRCSPVLPIFHLCYPVDAIVQLPMSIYLPYAAVILRSYEQYQRGLHNESAEHKCMKKEKNCGLYIELGTVEFRADLSHALSFSTSKARNGHLSSAKHGLWYLQMCTVKVHLRISNCGTLHDVRKYENRYINIPSPLLIVLTPNIDAKRLISICTSLSVWPP